MLTTTTTTDGQALLLLRMCARGNETKKHVTVAGRRRTHKAAAVAGGRGRTNNKCRAVASLAVLSTGCIPRLMASVCVHTTKSSLYCSQYTCSYGKQYMTALPAHLLLLVVV